MKSAAPGFPPAAAQRETHGDEGNSIDTGNMAGAAKRRAAGAAEADMQGLCLVSMGPNPEVSTALSVGVADDMVVGADCGSDVGAVARGAARVAPFGLGALSTLSGALFAALTAFFRSPFLRSHAILIRRQFAFRRFFALFAFIRMPLFLVSCCVDSSVVVEERLFLGPRLSSHSSLCCRQSALNNWLVSADHASICSADLMARKV